MAPIEFLLPFHGDPNMFREAVQSIRCQTSSSWQLLVIDDDYPDASVGNWVQALDDPRVRYLRNPTNLGANANYRKAIGLASAEHVVIMGADDRLRPNYVERVVRLLDVHDRPKVLQPGVAVIDHDGDPTLPVGDRVKSRLRQKFVTSRERRGEPVATSLLRGNWTYFPSLVWHLDTIREIGLRRYDVVQDLALLIDVLIDGGDLVVDDEVTFEYRRHAASDSALKSLTGARFMEERAYFGTIAKELSAAGWSIAAREARRRITSRAHALALLPRTVRSADLRSTGHLLRHTFAI